MTDESTTRFRKEPNLSRDLHDFASARPEGWNHEDWIRFLEALEARGHDISNRDAIGVALEHERLAVALSKVKGIGPKRIAALVERYENTWSVRHASVGEIAAVAGIPSAKAEEVKAAVG